MITRNKLVETLKEGGNYKEEDSLLIDELYHNIDVIRKAKKHIKDNGILTQGDKEGRLHYQSQGFKIYDSAFGHVMTIIRKLGLSPRDRKELGAALEASNDGFD